MKRDHSSAFVNITGSLFLSICLLMAGFLSYSFSKEKSTEYAGPGLNPETYWDETMCRCLSEQAEEPEAIVLESKNLWVVYQPVKLLSNISLAK